MAFVSTAVAIGFSVPYAEAVILSTLLTAAAAKDTPPDIWGSLLSWLFGAGGLVLVVMPVIVGAWLTQIQTRGPRARVVAIKTAMETLTLLEKDSPEYLAVKRQLTSEVEALGVPATTSEPTPVDGTPSGERTDTFLGVEFRESLATPGQRRSFSRRARWWTGSGAAIGAVVLVLGFMQSASTGEPSGLAVLGSIIFMLGAAFTLIFNATVYAEGIETRQD